MSAVADNQHPDEMESLRDSVRDELLMSRPFEGSFLPAIIVERQLELARLTPAELQHRFIAYLVALTLRYGPQQTPRKMLLELAEQTKIRDSSWYERTGPEFRRLIRKAGINLSMLKPDS